MYQPSIPVPPQLKMIASQTYIWEALVLNGATAPVASKRMNVSLGDAKEGLQAAADRLRTRMGNCDRAETVLKGSGAVKQEISRRAWDDVALGLRGQGA